MSYLFARQLPIILNDFIEIAMVTTGIPQEKLQLFKVF